MESITTFFFGIITGLVTGVLPPYILEKYRERNQEKIAHERKENIRKAFIYEITVNHKLDLYNVLETYRKNWKKGPFSEPKLKWVSHYPDVIYDVYSKELDLFFQQAAVQIHYYYLLIKQLNTYSHEGVPTKDINSSSRYLTLAIDTYSALFGVLNLLTHQPGSHAEL